MSVICEYVDYHVSASEWFIQRIQAQMNARDIKAITNGRTPTVSVSGAHPLVRLTGSLLNAGTADFTGILPCVSVIDGDSGEENTTLGQGQKTAAVITQQWVEDMRTNFPNPDARALEGLITNDQIGRVEIALTQNSGKLFMLASAYWERETVFVSLWGHSVQERNILGRILKSVLYGLRSELSARDVRDLSIRTSSGLVNFDFGQIIHGQESELTYLNKFTNYVIVDDVPAADADTIVVDVHGQYRTYGQKTEDTVTIWEEIGG